MCGNHFAMPQSVSEEFGRSLRRREAFPKSSEGPRAAAKRFRRVRKVLAPSRSISEEFGRSSRHREALLRCAGTISRCREVLPRCAGTISRCRGDLPKNSETCPLPNPAPRYPFCCFFRKFVSVIIGFMEKRTRHDLSVMKRLEDWI